jgi:hypothetical protein
MCVCVCASTEKNHSGAGVLSFTKSGKLTVVLGPPAKVAPTDGVVKEVADEDPGHVVEGRRGRQAVRAGEDDREVEVLEDVQSELSVYGPLDEGRDRAN